MHHLITALNRAASAHYARTFVYPTHVYVGAAVMTQLKKDVTLQLIRSDAKQMTDVKVIKKLTILGMRVHPRLFLVDRIVAASCPLTDEQLLADHPPALLAQLPTT